MRMPVVACLTLFVVSGPWCTGSDHTIASDADMLADSLLVGQWRGEGDTSGMLITIARAPSPGSRDYAVTVRLGDGRVTHDVLAVTRIGDALFGDLYPAKSEEDASVWNTIAVHLILRAEQSPDRIVVRYMDPTWLQQYLKAHPGAISTVEVGDWIVFTDSTAAVRAFLLKTLHEDSAYVSQSAAILRVHCKKGRPCPPPLRH